MWMITYMNETTGNRHVKIFKDSEFNQAKIYSRYLIESRDTTHAIHVQLSSISDCYISDNLGIGKMRRINIEGSNIDFEVLKG